MDFNFTSSGFSSTKYKIKTLQKPVIKQFKVSVDYPDYTGRKDEMLDNIGDIIAPQGTTLRWAFNTEHTDNMQFALGNGTPTSMIHTGNQFFYNYRFMRDTTYSVLISNQQVQKMDSLHYNVSIIPDQMPSINVQQYNDSLTGEYVLFVGEAGDDYGIRSISLNYAIQHTNENGNALGPVKNGSIPVPNTGGTFAQFNQFLQIDELNLQAGDMLTYNFSVCDNDAVNGSKCTKSVTFNYEKPSAKN